MQTETQPKKDAQVRVSMKLTEEFQTKRITLTRLRFETESIAQAAYIIHNFQPMISALSVRIIGFNDLGSLDAFYEFLSQLGTWNGHNEYAYIPAVQQYINSRNKNNNNK